MEKIDWTKFTRKTAVKSTLKVMYDAWTKSSEIEKWFLKGAHYSTPSNTNRNANENIQSGDIYTWSWYNYPTEEQNKIIEANGTDFISFGFAGDCVVEVKLKEIDGYVIVDISQFNIPTDDKSKLDIRLGCDRGWSFYLINLKSYYEHGNDLRIKNTEIHQQIYG